MSNETTHTPENQEHPKWQTYPVSQMNAKLTVSITYAITQNTNFESLQSELEKIINQLTVSDNSEMRPINLIGSLQILEGQA